MKNEELESFIAYSPYAEAVGAVGTPSAAKACEVEVVGCRGIFVRQRACPIIAC